MKRGVAEESQVRGVAVNGMPRSEYFEHRDQMVRIKQNWRRRRDEKISTSFDAQAEMDKCSRLIDYWNRLIVETAS